MAKREGMTGSAKKRYFLKIAYDGTEYAGWQKLKDKITVQSRVDDALSTLLNTSVISVGCSRTDAGVHASEFFLHFDTDRYLLENMIFKLNNILPPDIKALDLSSDIPPDAHARYSAVSRTYQYHMHFHKNPFLEKYSAFFPWLPLDCTAMQYAADLLLSNEDFSMFCRKMLKDKPATCRLSESSLDFDDDKGTFIYTVSSDRFLHGMVRRIVGILLYIGKGRITQDEFRQALKERKMFKINFSVPAKGLFLVKVLYPFIQE